MPFLIFLILFLLPTALADPVPTAEAAERIEPPEIVLTTPPVSASAELVDENEPGIAVFRLGVGPDLTLVTGEPELEGLMAWVSPFVELFSPLDPYHDETAFGVVFMSVSWLGRVFHKAVGARVSGWLLGHLGLLLGFGWRWVAPVLPAAAVSLLGRTQRSAAEAKGRLLGTGFAASADPQGLLAAKDRQLDHARRHIAAAEKRAHSLEMLGAMLIDRALGLAEAEKQTLYGALQDAGQAPHPAATQASVQASMPAQAGGA